MPPNGFIGKRLHQPPLLRNPTAISRLPPWRSEFFKVPSIELCCGVLWERRDSNPLSRKAADLQSAPTHHRWRSPSLGLGIPPTIFPNGDAPPSKTLAPDFRRKKGDMRTASVVLYLGPPAFLGCGGRYPASGIVGSHWLVRIEIGLAPIRTQKWSIKNGIDFILNRFAVRVPSELHGERAHIRQRNDGVIRQLSDGGE